MTDQLRELVQADVESDLMDFRPEQVNGRLVYSVSANRFRMGSGETP